MNQPKISVAMCTYNGSRYLPEQITSIMSQSVLPDEIVILDDCSQDGCDEYLSQVAAKYPTTIRYQRNETNLGSTVNFERAINACRGEIIVLSDQDDSWLPGRLERIASEFSNSPTLDIYFADAQLIDAKGASLDKSLWDSLGLKNGRDLISGCSDFFALLLKGNVVTGATMAFRSRIKEHVLPIPECWVHDAWIAFVSAANRLKFHADLVPTVQYRVHPTQQIGVSPENGVFSKIRKAGTITSTVLEAEHRRYEVAYLSVAQLFGEHDLRCRAIREKLKHLQARISIKESRLPRFDLATKELYSGRYHRFSLGSRSFAADCCWRFVR